MTGQGKARLAYAAGLGLMAWGLMGCPLASDYDFDGYERRLEELDSGGAEEDGSAGASGSAGSAGAAGQEEPDASLHDGPVDQSSEQTDSNALQLLQATHDPDTMRAPLYPKVGEHSVIVIDSQMPAEIEAVRLHWQLGKENAVEAFSWNATHSYWQIPWQVPQHAVGALQYYIELTPKHPDQYKTTYMCWDENASQVTGSEQYARTLSYKTKSFAPVPGDLMITEVMVNAPGGHEPAAEWFELLNLADKPLLLHDCKLSDNTHNGQPITGQDLILWPATYATLGATANLDNAAGFQPDGAYGTQMSFSNSGDALILSTPDEEVIDSVDWTLWSSGLYDNDGCSMQFSGSTMSPWDNNLSSNWCASQSWVGDTCGTPNGPSDSCAR